jgi:hypothetical protein
MYMCLLTDVLPRGDWKPKVPPYNFLKMMDDDKKEIEERRNNKEERITHDLADEEEIQDSYFGKDGMCNMR